MIVHQSVFSCIFLNWNPVKTLSSVIDKNKYAFYNGMEYLGTCLYWVSSLMNKCGKNTYLKKEYNDIDEILGKKNNILLFNK